MIKGYELKNAIISASNNIINNKKKTDDLNIFPVPDGDTGTNMSMTINCAKKALNELDDSCGVNEVAAAAASAMLRGARGNSGVILSLLFRGFSVGLEGKSEANGKDLAKALSIGVEAAYNAVMKPTEGTILTVSRLGAEIGVSASEIDSSTVFVLSAICEGAQKALDQTPELLPVLKKAGVVDAGGFGFVLILTGMLSYLKHGEFIDVKEQEEQSGYEDTFASAAAEYDGEITFTYCTEFIVTRDSNCEKKPIELRTFIETLGDSVVVVDDDEIIKVHVHTDNPGLALQSGLEHGSLLTVKIENMREQHEKLGGKAKLKPVEPTEEYGFVAVSAGAGLAELFTDLGCSNIVSGGQTMNPSAEDLVAAILATPAKNVFVLPNNKNIIMAALQAVPMVTDRRVIVIQTKTIPQGVTAMLSFDPDKNIEENQVQMTEALATVGTGLVTFAARNSEYGGHKIKEGDILGLVNGKMQFIEKTAMSACSKVTKTLLDKNASFVTIFYGEEVSDEQAQETYNKVKSKLPANVELNLVNGGQPIYYYIISVE